MDMVKAETIATTTTVVKFMNPISLVIAFSHYINPNPPSSANSNSLPSFIDIN